MKKRNDKMKRVNESVGKYIWKVTYFFLKGRKEESRLELKKERAKFRIKLECRRESRKRI